MITGLNRGCIALKTLCCVESKGFTKLVHVFVFRKKLERKRRAERIAIRVRQFARQWDWINATLTTSALTVSYCDESTMPLSTCQHFTSKIYCQTWLCLICLPRNLSLLFSVLPSSGEKFFESSPDQILLISKCCLARSLPSSFCSACVWDHCIVLMQ